jgi:hypothetical protein
MYRRIDQIDEVIIHCADTPNGSDEYNIDDIRRWHKERGFKDVGYHRIINPNGTVDVGRDNIRVGAHCRGHNIHSMGVCLIGRDKFTLAQWTALRCLLISLVGQFVFPALRTPNYSTAIKGHNEYNPIKACPGFDVQDWVRGNFEPLEGHIYVEDTEDTRKEPEDA